MFAVFVFREEGGFIGRFVGWRVFVIAFFKTVYFMFCFCVIFMFSVVFHYFKFVFIIGSHFREVLSYQWFVFVFQWCVQVYFHGGVDGFLPGLCIGVLTFFLFFKVVFRFFFAGFQIGSRRLCRFLAFFKRFHFFKR